MKGESLTLDPDKHNPESEQERAIIGVTGVESALHTEQMEITGVWHLQSSLERTGGAVRL